MKLIYFIEKNIRGAWVIYGVGDIKQYYYYTKTQAKEEYLKTLNVFYNEPVKKGRT